MTDAEAIELLATWVVTLQAQLDTDRRISGWQMARIRYLERLVERLDNPMHRFWIDAYTPEQAAELARELAPV